MLKITQETNHIDSDLKILGSGLDANAMQKRGFSPPEDFAFFLRDDDNKIVGGCNGVMYYGCLYTDQLWVDEKYRGQNYGTKLLLLAEEFGKSQGCLFSNIETMEWEALGFYQKLGYKIEMERQGYLQGVVMYLLRKDW